MLKRFYWGYVILGVGFLLVLASYGIRFGYGILIPPMKSSLNLTDVQSGFIASAYFLSYTLSAPLIGFIVDRVGCKKVIPLLCVVMGFGTFMMGSVKEWSLGVFLFALVGVGSHAGWVAIIRLVTMWFKAEKRGRAIGVVNSGYGVGYGLMGLLLPIIVDTYGWQHAWYLMGVFTLTLAAASALLLKEKESTDRRREFRTQEATQIILSSGTFWFIASSYFAIAFATSTTMTFMVAYFNLDLSIDYAYSAGLASAVAFSGIPASLILPYLSDKIGRIQGLALCNLGVAVSIYSMVAIGASLHLLMLLAIMYGVFYASMFPIYAACASEYFEEKSSGSVIGLWTLFYGVGATVSPIVAGFIRESMGSYSPAFTLSAAAMVLSVILLLPVGVDRSKRAVYS
ncbi:MAG: MFS transporter [Nitrososphaerales archaeon]